MKRVQEKREVKSGGKKKSRRAKKRQAERKTEKGHHPGSQKLPNSGTNEKKKRECCERIHKEKY